MISLSFSAPVDYPPTCVSDKKSLMSRELGLAEWITFCGEEDG